MNAARRGRNERRIPLWLFRRGLGVSLIFNTLSVASCGGNSTAGGGSPNREIADGEPSPGERLDTDSEAPNDNVVLEPGALGTLCQLEQHSCSELCLVKNGKVGTCSLKCEIQGYSCENPIPGAPVGMCVNDEFPGDGAHPGFCEFFCDTDADCKPFGTVCGELEPHDWIKFIFTNFTSGICRPTDG